MFPPRLASLPATSHAPQSRGVALQEIGRLDEGPAAKGRALRYRPDWRWLAERADSLWYPTMRLFRQTRYADWEGVFAEIAEALREKVGRTG